MSLRTICCALLVALLAWAALPMAAQTTNTGQSGPDNNLVQPSPAGSAAAPAGDAGETKPAKWEVFTGYSWMNSNSTLTGTKTLGTPPTPVPVTEELKDAKGGFVVDISYFFNRWFGITFDSGAHFGNNYDYDEALVGPTIRFPAEHVQPFIHVLGGWTRLSPGILNSNDVFGLAGGGGIDLKVSRHLNIRLAEADYIYAQHNYGAGNPKYVDSIRLSTGLVFLGGIGEELPVSATCSVDKAEVWAGEPVKASVAPRNFNPKHKLNYDWTTNGGKVEGSGETVTVNTTGVAEGQSYNVSVKVTDPHDKKAVTSCQASFATKKRLPPTINCSANPTTVIQGGAITVHSDASSPQGGPVTVNITSTCGVSGQGTDVSVDTSNLQPGSCTVTCNVTDDHQLTGSNSTSFTVQPKPTPTPTPVRAPNLELRSVYFATAQPTARNPNAGLVKSQQDTLKEIASEFQKYLAVKPDAKLMLQAHADPRGGAAYNQKLTERRAARVKNFLVEQGVPDGSLETQALGIQEQLTPDQVRQSLEDDPTLTANEKKRIVRNMRTIVLAANRRVDITLNAPGVPSRLSERRFPFSAADALSLIGGREKPKAAPKTTPRRPARRPARRTTKKK